MGVHVETSQQVRTKLKKQKRVATATSLSLSLIFVCLFLASLAAITVLVPTQEIEAIISHKAPPEDQQLDDKPVIQKQQRQSPVPPPASFTVASVITTTAPTDISIPDTNQMLTVESEDFGSSDDFGMGYGFGDSQNEITIDTSSAFFGTKVIGSRIAYVIDFSRSMNSGGRVELMKKELSDSVRSLEEGAEFALIFFAGAVWQASDTIIFDSNDEYVKTTIQENKKKITWKSRSKISDSEFKKIKPDWLKSSQKQISESLTQIENMPLAYGTEWVKPLQKALEMQPQPEIIVFMTDGDAYNAEEAVASITKIAKRKSVMINAITLLEPKAATHMKALAEETGGTAVIVRDANTIENLFTGEVTKR